MKNTKLSHQTILHAKEEQQLCAFLEQKMGGMSKTSIKLLLKNRRVEVNGAVCARPDYLLQVGDEIVINNHKPVQQLSHPKLKIVYEDDNLLVVEKGVGLLTVATYAGSREVTCVSLLKNYIRKSGRKEGIYVVHRLDRETSGLLVFAKSQDVQHYMRDYWKELVQKRQYIAVAEGIMPHEEDTITTWLTEDDKTKMVYSSPFDDGGKKAITHYKVLKQSGDYSLLELQLETGRTNQIRVHLASIGHPIVSDRKYGSDKQPIIDRLALHAQTLDFIHPVSEQVLHFQTNIPKEFNIPFQRQ